MAGRRSRKPITKIHKKRGGGAKENSKVVPEVAGEDGGEEEEEACVEFCFGILAVWAAYSFA